MINKKPLFSAFFQKRAVFYWTFIGQGPIYWVPEPENSLLTAYVFKKENDNDET